MKYISIGAVLNKGTEHVLDVTHGGMQFRLTGEKARLWLNGRLGFAEAFNPMYLNLLEQLFKMGLVIKCDGSRAEEFRALCKCTIVPAECKYPYWFLRTDEKLALQRIRNAGLVLSMAELVYLIDRNVPFEETLLGSGNAQALVERIYTKDTVYNNILENQMERAPSRNRVAKAVLGLLRKKRIVLLYAHAQESSKQVAITKYDEAFTNPGGGLYGNVVPFVKSG